MLSLSALAVQRAGLVTMRDSAEATNPSKFDGRGAKELCLQAKIDRVSAAGGGIVRIPAGAWTSKPFVLRSRITLELDAEAILFASTNLADYAHLPRGKRYFIFADHADDLTIRGKGVLCGRGWAFRESRRLEGSSQPQDLPVMMRFSRCRNLRLEDFTYREAGAWGCHLRNCDGVTMRGVRCNNHVNNTNDGIDIESSNVLIENCDIDANDDALCFKTESDKTFPVTNVVVRNSRFASTCNGVKFGTGSYCDVKNVLIENCEFYRPTARHGSDRFGVMPGVTNRLCGLAGLALEVVDGGRLDGVVIRNVTIDGYMTPVFIRINNRHDAPVGVNACLKNVLIENVKSTVADSYIACSITGIPGFRPENITLRNVELSFPGGGKPEDAVRPVPEMEKAYPECTMFHIGWPDHAEFHNAVLPAWGFFIRHADNVSFEHVRLHCLGRDARKPIVAEDCNNFQVKQGLRGCAPYRLVVQEGKIDRTSLVPDFMVSTTGIEASADRFETVTHGVSGRLAWSVFRERQTSVGVLVYEAPLADVSESDLRVLKVVASRHGAAIVGCRAAAPDWKDAQRNAPEWDWRKTDLSLFYDPKRVVPYEFRIDAPRHAPEKTKGAAHIFDFSLDKGGEKYVESWDEYMPTRVAAGEFDCVVGPKVVFTPMVYETPVRTIVEAGMTLFWLREHHPDISVELNPIANVEATFANAVNTELRAFSGIEGVMLANDFPVAEKQDAHISSALKPVSRIDCKSRVRGSWWWFRRLAQKSRQIAGAGGAFDLVMIGDSCTHGWDGDAYWSAGRSVYDEMCSRRRILNLGYGGDSTQNVLWRLQAGELDGYRAKVIQLMIGTNNGSTPEETAQGVARILDVIAERQPKAKVLLMALLPRSDPESADRRRVERINGLIHSLADGKRVIWFDLSDRYLQPDGQIAPGIMTDEWNERTNSQYNLHPYELGYEIWRGALEEILAREEDGL